MRKQVLVVSVRALALALAGVLSGGAFFAGAKVQAQTARTPDDTASSIWDGIYTEEQAARGEVQYQAACGACHGTELEGGRGAQPLKGDFIRYWYGYPLNSLFTRIKYTMPSGAPASLSDAAYLDIVSHILHTSDFPSGREELRVSMLENIHIQGEEGPQPIPNYAFVRVIGCLERAGEDQWTLISASEPVRTRDANPSRDEERRNSLTKELGDQQFPLMSIYPNPAAHTDHRVEVKGFWIQGADEHINVNTLQPLASSCDAG